MDNLFMSPLDDFRSGRGKRLISSEKVSTEWLMLSTGLLKSSLPRSPYHKHSCGKYLHIFAHSERSMHMPLIQISLSPVSSPSPSKSLTIQPNHCPQLMNLYVIIHQIIFSSKHSEQLFPSLKVLPSGRISLHHCPSGRCSSVAAVCLLVVPA